MLRVVIAALLLLMQVPAAAFDGDEHRYVSNLALRIAIAHARGLDSVTAAKLRLFTDTWDRSFGDVVALADQVKDVAPIFDNAAHRTAGEYSDIDWDYLHQLRQEALRSVQAKILNENHFQSLALVTHLVNHRAAIGEARAKHWIRAMLFEAYALHHIEDFLSPGHVATARAGMADFVALGLHDKYTAHGLDFRFASDCRLLEIVDFVARSHHTIDFSALRDPKSDKDSRSSDFHLDADAFEALAVAMRTASTEHFLGDSHLHRKRLQAAFVTAVAALSISELLREPCRQDEESAFSKYGWTWGSAGRTAIARTFTGNLLQDAHIVGGGYRDVVRPLQFFFPGELLFITLQNTANPDDRGKAFEGFIGQRSLEVEALIMAVPRTLRNFAPTVLVGYAQAVGPGPSARSAHVRLIAPIPRTNLQLSIVRGVDLDHHSREAIGAALEAGFGLIFVRFGAQQDRNTPPIGATQNRKVVYTFGASGIVPGRAVLHRVLRR